LVLKCSKNCSKSVKIGKFFALVIFAFIFTFYCIYQFYCIFTAFIKIYQYLLYLPIFTVVKLDFYGASVNLTSAKSFLAINLLYCGKTW